MPEFKRDLGSKPTLIFDIPPAPSTPNSGREEFSKMKGDAKIINYLNKLLLGNELVNQSVFSPCLMFKNQPECVSMTSPLK